jgi:hypothetical protein
MMNAINKDQSTTPTKRKTVDENTEVMDSTESPESQKLRRMTKDLDQLMELRREERTLREKYQMYSMRHVNATTVKISGRDIGTIRTRTHTTTLQL